MKNGVSPSCRSCTRLNKGGYRVSRHHGGGGLVEKSLKRLILKTPFKEIAFNRGHRRRLIVGGRRFYHIENWRLREEAASLAQRGKGKDEKRRKSKRESAAARGSLTL